MDTRIVTDDFPGLRIKGFCTGATLIVHAAPDEILCIEKSSSSAVIVFAGSEALLAFPALLASFGVKRDDNTFAPLVIFIGFKCAEVKATSAIKRRGLHE